MKDLRELTEYEKKKWFNRGSNGLFSPDFLMDGDELGQAYDSLRNLEESYSDCLSDGFVEHLKVEILNMYYYQMLVYADAYGGYDDPDSLGLPPAKEFFDRAGHSPTVIASWASGTDFTDKAREAWDWAMEWRQDHSSETFRKYRIRSLEEELARLKNDSLIIQ